MNLKQVFLIPLAGLLVMSVFVTTVQATSYDWSYTWASGGVLSGLLEGDLQPDLNTVLVASTSGVSYSSDASLDFGPSQVGAVVTLDGGVGMRFKNNVVDLGDAGFTVENALFTWARISVAGETANREFETYDASHWEMTEVTGSPVPEPSTMLLFGTGVLGLIGYRRRRKTLTL